MLFIMNIFLKKKEDSCDEASSNNSRIYENVHNEHLWLLYMKVVHNEQLMLKARVSSLKEQKSVSWVSSTKNEK